jgi:hypothetical protein
VRLVLLLAACSAPVTTTPMPDLALPAKSLGELMPQVVAVNSPPGILARPTVVAVTWDNDPRRADIEAFLGQFAASSAWAAQTAEYGVGALTVGTPQHLAGSAPATMTGTDVETLLQSQMAAWGPRPRDAVYGFFFPAGSIVDSDVGKCCTDLDGYHFDVVAGGLDTPYFIACACPGFDGAGVDDLAQLTTVAAHELVESATDPLSGGFAQTDDMHAVWTYVTDGEVADLCEQNDTTFWQPADMTYTIQRTWSNVAAAAGKDPCVGDPQPAYYQTVPEQPDAVTIDVGFGPWATVGAHLAAGDTRMLAMRVQGDGGPFNVSVQDYLEWLGSPALLQIVNPSAAVRAGDVVQVQITAGQAGDPGLGGHASAFIVTTTPVAGGVSTYFYGLVSE